MNNVREGKVNSNVRLLGKKGELKALLISGATAKVIDLKELPQRLVRDLGVEPEMQINTETPLVSPQYAGNPVVTAASAVAGFDVTQTPPVQETDIPEIVPVSIATPAVEEPVVRPTINVQPVQPEPALNSEVVQSNETPIIETPVFETQKVVTPAIDDPVISAINNELIKPQSGAQEPEPVLQTPQAFETEVGSKETIGDYVNVIDEMLKVKERHLLELRKIQEDMDAKFEALKEKYKNEVDDLVRETEKLRENKKDFAPIQEALESQSQVLDNQYSQGIQNVR